MNRLFKPTLFVALITVFFVKSSLSQGDANFEPHGTPFVKIFSNFHYELNSKSTAFDLKRSYFGYKFKMSQNISGVLTLDVGTPSISFGDTLTKGNTSLELTAYLKNAALSYKKGNFGFDFGMVGLKHFKTQEKFWGYRYIFKSFQDENKFAPSADLGAIVSYKVHKMFSFDVTVRNGEGYKHLQADDKFLTGLGLTLQPISGLTIRGYYDYLPGTDAQTTISHFVGYEIKNFKIAAEYNLQQNHKNTKDFNLGGLSTYATYKLNDKFELFGRFDHLTSGKNSSTPYPGSQIIAGAQYSLLKKVKVALNLQSYSPEDSSHDAENGIYMSFLYAF